MAYINTETNQYPVSEQDIRREYPNTSFTTPFVAPHPYVPVLLSPTPTVNNQVLQFAREVLPTQDLLGNWMQTFEVVDKYQEYTDPEGVLHTKEEQEAAALVADEDEKKKRIKQQAETLLKESDWSQYADVTNPLNTPHLTNGDDWVTYRASVRSIAINPPLTVENWPTKPEEQWSV